MAIATLTIDINAKLANIEQDLGRVAHLAEQSGKRMQSAFDGAKAALGGLAIAGGLAAIANGIRSTADFADEMGKAAQKVGSTAESLSELKHAADLSDVSFEQLQTGLGKLAKNAEQFRDGSKDAVDAFSKIGLDPTKFRDTSELFGAVAEKLSKMEDGARKTAIAQELLGKSGAELIPLLNSGADGLREAAEEAHKFGIVITEESVRAAEKFNDNMTRLGNVTEGLKIKAFGPMVESMSEISEVVLQAARDAGILTAAWVALGGAATYVLGLDEKSQLNKRLESINKQVDIARKQLASGSLNPDGASDKFFSFLVPDVKLGEKAKDRLRQTVADLEKERSAIVAQFSTVPEIKPPSFEPKDIQKPGSKGKPLDLEELRLEELRRGISMLGEDERTLADDIEKVNAMLADQAEAWRVISDLQSASDNSSLADLEAQSSAEQNHLDVLRQKAQTYQELLDPTLKLLNLQAELNDMVENGILTDEEAAAALKKLGEVRDEGKDAMDDLRRAVEGFGKDAASALVDFATSGKTSFGDMVDSWLKSLARLAATRAFDPITKQLDQWFSNADFGSLFSGSTNYIDGKAISGDVFSNLLSGARATGGPVAAGSAYLVGERGPEIFMPGASGNIVPNHALGGNNVTVHIDARGADSAAAARIEAIASQLPAMIKGQMIKEMRPGGVLA